MAIYKPTIFDIPNGVEMTNIPNYPSMRSDVLAITSDTRFVEGKWVIAKCIEVVRGDDRHALNQNYPIFVGYENSVTPEAFAVAAPCPPFCTGSNYTLAFL